MAHLVRCFSCDSCDKWCCSVAMSKKKSRGQPDFSSASVAPFGWKHPKVVEGRPDKNCKYYLWTLKLEKVLRPQHTPAAIVPALQVPWWQTRLAHGFSEPCGNCRTLKENSWGIIIFRGLPCAMGRSIKPQTSARTTVTTRVAITKYHIYTLYLYIYMCKYILYYVY